MLKETFQALLSHYSANEQLTKELWTEIELHYSEKERHYHTLQHLDDLLAQLTEIKSNIRNWETTMFTLYYHDIVYNPQKPDNEERSAELAGKRMKQLSVPDSTISICKNQILATRSHTFSTDEDTNYFTDADLSILGHERETYAMYAGNVRREYSIYPDRVYNPGGQKVLKHFLSMGRIFKTDYFFSKFEARARENIATELSNL